MALPYQAPAPAGFPTAPNTEPIRRPALSDIRDLKKQLRKAALARRDALDLVWRIEAAMTMAEQAGLAGIEPGAIVSGFWPMRSEVDIRPLMMELAANGARLCLPAILDKETIVFRELIRGAPMVEMGYGTMGPGEKADVLDPSVMLVPLAAFDASGNRIGYGAGYYDRAIARLREEGRSPRLIGIAFDCQLVDAIPAEGHDVPLDAIWTESGLRPFPFA